MEINPLRPEAIDITAMRKKADVNEPKQNKFFCEELYLVSHLYPVIKNSPILAPTKILYAIWKKNDRVFPSTPDFVGLVYREYNKYSRKELLLFFGVIVELEFMNISVFASGFGRDFRMFVTKILGYPDFDHKGVRPRTTFNPEQSNLWVHGPCPPSIPSSVLNTIEEAIDDLFLVRLEVSDASVSPTPTTQFKRNLYGFTR